MAPACLSGCFSPRTSVSHCALIAPGHLSGLAGEADAKHLPAGRTLTAVPPHTLGSLGRALKPIFRGLRRESCHASVGTGTAGSYANPILHWLSHKWPPLTLVCPTRELGIQA